MNRTFLFGCLVSLFTILSGGCHTSTGTISRDPLGYLQLANVTEGLTAIVDELPLVNLAPEKGLSRLQVAPGRHRIRVIRGSTVLVDRTILVSDLQTLEIIIP
jgi:hypothetical protein